MNYTTLVEVLMFVAVIVGASAGICWLVQWIDSSGDRKYKHTDDGESWEKKATPQKNVSQLFLGNAMFCPYCLLYDYWFTGGGLWSPERCPKHNVDEVILWKDMTTKQQKKAARLHDEAWFRKFNNHFFNEHQRKLY